jgi:hypothetical protein
MESYQVIDSGGIPVGLNVDWQGSNICEDDGTVGVALASLPLASLLLSRTHLSFLRWYLLWFIEWDIVQKDVAKQCVFTPRCSNALLSAFRQVDMLLDRALPAPCPTTRFCS